MSLLTDLQQAGEWVKALFAVSLLLIVVISPIPVIVVYPALRAFRDPQDRKSVTYPVFALWGLWLYFPCLPVILSVLIWLAGEQA